MNYKLQAVLDLGPRSNELGYKHVVIVEAIRNSLLQEYEHFEEIDGKRLEQPALAAKINPDPVTALAHGLYLKYQGYFTHLSIKDNTISLMPIEPFKHKIDFYGKTAIDTAFYMNQLLNLCNKIQLKGLFTEVR